MSLGAWDLPEELRMVQQTVIKFMKNEVCPQEDKLAHDAYELPVSMTAATPGLFSTNTDPCRFFDSSRAIPEPSRRCHRLAYKGR